ncbi:MAG: hypothetical protein DMF72_20715 [Acidobacteria bacterium]|nr:MAG: hypothetical protein DMF72_20715 [Acidobacteriota bacterium]
MKKILLTLFGGLILGALATAYFLGAPRGRALPGVPLKPPDRNADTSGTVAVTIEEKFFDSLLGTIFNKLGPPQLKLSQLEPHSAIQPASFQASCNDTVVLNPESGNTKTGVRFTGGKIVAPLAFSGNYSVLTRCVQFKGTGKATVDLSYDVSKQTVFGALDVQDVALDDVPPVISTLVTAFVRRAIAEQLNPFEVLPVSQLTLSLPVQASGGTVKANVKDVRSEVQEGALKLYLTYDFTAERK